MRARMALKLAEIEVELREISLRNKPAHLLQVSPKATVPVLILSDGSVIEESLEIMQWAIEQSALKKHALGGNIHAAYRALVLENDNSFKQTLDAYKYPERHPNKIQTQHRADGEIFLQKLESLLEQNKYLFGAAPSLADIAIFPFIRQFAAVDNNWFGGVNGQGAPYPKLRAWLNDWLNSDLFKSVMTKNPTYVG